MRASCKLWWKKSHRNCSKASQKVWIWWFYHSSTLACNRKSQQNGFLVNFPIHTQRVRCAFLCCRDLEMNRDDDITKTEIVQRGNDTSFTTFTGYCPIWLSFILQTSNLFGQEKHESYRRGRNSTGRVFLEEVP